MHIPGVTRSTQSDTEKRDVSAAFESWLAGKGIDLDEFAAVQRRIRSDVGGGGGGGGSKTGAYIGLVAVLVSALVVSFQGRVWEGLFNPPYTQAERDRLRDVERGLMRQTERVDLLAADGDGVRGKVETIERKVDRLLWERGIDPKKVVVD